MGNPSCLGVVTFDRAVRCLSNWVTGRSDADITTRDSTHHEGPSTGVDGILLGWPSVASWTASCSIKSCSDTTSSAKLKVLGPEPSRRCG